MANPQIIVEYLAKTEGLSSGLKDAESSAQGLGGRLGKTSRIALAAAGAAGLGALVATLKTGAAEFAESQKVAAQTEAVLKSTGGAAGVTAKQVADLAGAIMRKSGIDDEAIQSGENLLLTFKQVQNQAGKGNDIFNQATRVMADMSVALGQDMKTSAIQLGKALNDPVKGITALRRVGVSFTKAQQDQIKALVASGHTLEAQKIILKELNSEFGGSAEAAGKTLPGQLSILRESFNNLAGQLVSVIAPILSTIAELFVKYPGLMKVVVIGVLALSAALVALNVALGIAAIVSAPLTIWFVGIAAAVAALIVVIVLIVKHWDDLVDAFKNGFNAIKNLAKGVLDWLKANWPLIVAIIGGPLAAVVVLAVKYWDQIKAGATAAWNAIKAVISSVLGAIQSTVSSVLNAIQQAVASSWNAIAAAISTVLSAIQQAVSAAWNQVRSTVQTVTSAIQASVTASWNQIRAAVAAAVDALEASVKASFNALRTAITAATDAAEASVKSSFNAIRSAVIAAVDGLEASVKASWAAISGAISAAVGAIRGAINSLVELFHLPGQAAREAAGAVQDAIGGMIGYLQRAVGAVSAAANAIANAIKAPINAVIGAWNSLSFTVPTVHIPGFEGVKVAGKQIIPGWGGTTIGGGSWGFPNIAYLARGGVVDSPTMAVLGEAGREIVTPEALLRSILAEQRPDVRVFIGDTELRGLVRYEVRTENSRTAQTLLAGLA